MAPGLKACGGDARVLGSDLRAVEKSLRRNISSKGNIGSSVFRKWPPKANLSKSLVKLPVPSPKQYHPL